MKIKLKSTQVPSSLKKLEEVLLGVREIEDRSIFFDPPTPLDISLKALGLSAQSVQIAIKRLIKAKQSREQVVVYGDYDADGISATAIVWQTLNQLGFKVMPFIPDRHKHGYGLSLVALQEVIDQHHPSLILTVDNGIVAHAQIEWLKSQQIDVILTDHHQLELDKKGLAITPSATAVVHTTSLCGATVAWVLMRELVTSLKEDVKIVTKQFDLCGVATIADQVPLQTVNRSFAVFGLEALKQTRRPGLIKLFEQAGIKADQINERTVGYTISPRINAMGRMAHGLEALRLLYTSNQAQAGELAQVLESVNQDRRDLTLDLMALAVGMAEDQVQEHMIVVHHPDFHEGVIGLVAGRLVEKFAKPAVVIGTALSHGGQSHVAKASARSIEGVHITKFLRQIKSDLLSLGGHPLAAGFSLETAKIKDVTVKLQTLAREKISAKLLEQSLPVECQLPHNLLTIKTARLVESFRPFGQGNPQPLFLLKDLRVVNVKQMGQDSQHLKLMVRPALATSPSAQLFQVLMWGNGFRAEKLQTNMTVNLVCALEINQWRNQTSLQLVAQQIGFD
ncbi:MAG: single-stranded-DNA-specific exonuclease RecJ [Patescibacteria group bacterium]|nr:single-stranded-DNA-specific exonuclease RecJ [Patescibacteria group bacterium]